MTSKKILTIIYLNRSIALAKVSFSGKTANVSNYSEFSLPDGTIENAIVYDPRTVSGIVKEYINAVNFKQIDKSVACIPDNKVKIITYKYNDSLTEAQNEDELTNFVESEMNTAMPQLSVLTDTYTVRGETRTIVYAIRKEILDPYITASRFGASIFPASMVLGEALSKNLNEPTIVIYPRGNSLRFFIWGDGKVVANDVDGKNVLDVDENLPYGIKEIISHGENIIQEPIKKVLFVEGKKITQEDIQPFISGESNFTVEFYRAKDATLDQYKFLALKGLIKKVNDTGLEKPAIKKKVITSGGAPVHHNSSSGNGKIVILTVAIILFLIGLVVALGWTYYSNNIRKSSDNNNNTAVVTTTVAETTSIAELPLTSSPVISPTITQTTQVPTTTASDVKVDNTTVIVENGTGVAGQAKQVANIISALGFKDVKTGEKPPYNTDKTVVYYAKGYDAMADIIINKLRSKFALIYKQESTNLTYNKVNYDIVLVTGKR